MGWRDRARNEFRTVLRQLAGSEGAELECTALLGLPRRARIESHCLAKTR